MELLAHPQALGWVAVLLALGLLPQAAVAGPGLSVAFAVQVALAMLYHPVAAGVIAFLGALDLHRLRRRPLTVWWGCGLALVTVTAGGAVFHLVAGQDAPLARLLPAFVDCAVLGWLLYARTMCLKAWSQRGRLADLLERERRVVAELREVNRGKEQFVAVASHEMRTPLTAILGYVTTLRRQPIDDPAARDRFLEIVERQAQRLLS